MDGNDKTNQPAIDVSALIQDAIREFVTAEQQRSEPAYRAELVEERKRRESLEKRMNELVDENRRSRAMAEEADKNSTVRSELHRLGVAKIDLAYRAVKDDILRTEDGKLVARNLNGDQEVKEFLQLFVNDNPELLPARIVGGSGAGSGHKLGNQPSSTFDIDKIRPGMSAEDLDRARQEIARVAMQTLRGQ